MNFHSVVFQSTYRRFSVSTCFVSYYTNLNDNNIHEQKPFPPTSICNPFSEDTYYPKLSPSTGKNYLKFESKNNPSELVK